MTSDTSNKLCGTCKGILGTIRVMDWYTNLIHHESLPSVKQSARKKKVKEEKVIKGETCKNAVYSNLRREKEKEEASLAVQVKYMVGR